MSFQQKDYLQRLVEQLADALAALLKKRRAKEHAEVRGLVGDACRELLGMEYGVLTAVDAHSAAQLLGHPTRVRALAQLVQEDALGLEGLGDATGADRMRELAAALETEAQRMERG
jgi:hypothetical protein